MGRTGLFLCLGVCVTGVGCSSEPNRTSTAGGNIVGNDDPDAGVSDEDGEDNGDDGDDNTDEDPGLPGCESAGTDDDIDGDGFTPSTGDCNECSKQINAGAYDFPGDEWDEDCSGSPAAAGEDACDMGLALDSSDPKDAARALGLCKFVSESDKGWGVISARFTDATGAGMLADPATKGLLPSFGAAEPRAGASMLALSSGAARAPGQPGYTEACDSYGLALPCFAGISDAACPPDGYPKESPGCGGGGGIFDLPDSIYDQAALELKIRVPSNAKSFAFDSIFYTYEYPSFVCSAYNDFFVVFQDPKPAELPDQNIVFDAEGGSIGVNAGLLAVCDPDDQLPTAAKQFECGQGTGLLADTGFGAGEASCAQDAGMTPAGVGGASTGWLHTTSLVAPSTVITLRFAIWDTGDQALDSTVLVDKFEWSVEEPDVETTPIVVL